MKKILAILMVTMIFSMEASAKKTSIYKKTVAKELPTGEGSFIYDDYKPFASKPIKVWYYSPANEPNAKVLFVMHGNGRGAKGYFTSMLKYAKKYKLLLIVPEFDVKQFPSRDYHLGGIFDQKKLLKNKEDWTFSMIEPLFDYMKKNTGNKSDGYLLYGFSAGSQFVHRFLMFNPENRVIRAISGSAGTYTMPNYSIAYAYGLKNTDLPFSNLTKFYAKNFMVVVGDADTVLSRPDLIKTPEANQQGRDRVERGQNFYNSSKAFAAQQKVPFNWKFALVPHVGHAQGEMAGPVAKFLFEE